MTVKEARVIAARLYVAKKSNLEEFQSPVDGAISSIASAIPVLTNYKMTAAQFVSHCNPK